MVRDGLDDMIRMARQDVFGLGTPAEPPPPVGYEDRAARIVSSGKYGSHARLNWPYSYIWDVFIPYPLEVGTMGMCRVTRHIAGCVEGEFFPAAGDSE